MTTFYVGQGETGLVGESGRDGLYQQATDSYGAALDRLARAYEVDSDKRRDLLQEIHLALWRSFEGYQAQCSLRTWVYRVAHNAATSHVVRHAGTARKFVSLEEIEAEPDSNAGEATADQRLALERLLDLIHQLKPLDRQLMLSYLEGLDASAIGAITGISAGNVATKVHRIKKILARRFHKGGRHGK